MKTRDFGMNSKGEKATLYTFENQNGMIVEISDFGGAIYSLQVKDRDGNYRDVVLGYETPVEYESLSRTFFGVLVGRNANRIAGGRFTLNGKEYEVDQNQNGNNLHSGLDFYSFRVWNVKEVRENGITLTLHSPDGDQGYPGELDIEVSYTLTEDNGIQIEYTAIPKDDTLINLTNHSFFNLNGDASGTVLEQELWVDADAYTPTNGTLIPTGEIRPVDGTPMDFRTKKKVGRDLFEDYEALNIAGGYDHNWCLNNAGEYKKVVEFSSEESGITMEVYTDRPGVHIYGGAYLIDELGKNGCVYGKYQGICFETQAYPDAINQPNFPTTIVKAGEIYRTRTMYKFI